MSAHQLVASYVEAALKEAAIRDISNDVVARCLLSEAIRLFKSERPNDDIAAELTAAADNLDDEMRFVFMGPYVGSKPIKSCASMTASGWIPDISNVKRLVRKGPEADILIH